MEIENQKKKSPESQNPVVAKLNKIYEYLKPVKKLSRNKQVIITASFFSAIFLGIVVYLIAFTVVNKTSLIGNSYNKQEKNQRRCRIPDLAVHISVFRKRQVSYHQYADKRVH